MPKETDKKQKKEKRHFMKDFKAELKKVFWPTPKQLLNNTVAVIVFVIIIAAMVFVFDLAFESMNTYGIDKLKTMVEASNTSDDSSSEIEDVTDEVSEDSTDESETSEEESTDEETTNDESSEEVEE